MALNRLAFKISQNNYYGKRYLEDFFWSHIRELIGKHNGVLRTLYKLMCVLHKIKLKFFRNPKYTPLFKNLDFWCTRRLADEKS